jgi:ferrous iron transport protein B
MGSRSKATVLLEDPSELVVLDNPALPDTGRVVLIGQANVGKSVVFSRLTSRYVTISNFPGTTVEIFHGRVNLDGETVEIIDTPGINSTYASTEDERAALRVLQEDSPELIVQVADAKNMRRTLRLTAQLAQFGIPMVLTLNMMDECERK